MRLALEHFNNDISMSAVMGTISSSVKCNPVAFLNPYLCIGKDAIMTRKETLIATILLILLGTSMHFVHHVPFFNHFLRYIFPVTESVMAHMKMVFYPMLLLSFYFIMSRRDIRELGAPILGGLAVMPLIVAAFFTHISVNTGCTADAKDIAATSLYDGIVWNAPPAAACTPRKLPRSADKLLLDLKNKPAVGSY